MRLGVFLDELIKVEAAHLDALVAAETAKVAALHELRARLAAENEQTKGNPTTRTVEKQSVIDTVMGKHVEQPSPAQLLNQIRDPLAKSMGDLVSTNQLGMIRGLARELGVDADEECQAVLRCRTEELSKKAASAFIDHLQAIIKGQAVRLEM